MRTRLRESGAALILSVAACAGKSTTERIAEHERVRVAWEQTARFVGAEWARRTIPDAYAVRTLVRASEELRAERAKLQTDDVPEESRTRLRDALGAARARVDTLEAAVRARDRGAADRLVRDSPRANADSLLRHAALQ